MLKVLGKIIMYSSIAMSLIGCGGTSTSEESNSIGTSKKILYENDEIKIYGYHDINLSIKKNRIYLNPFSNLPVYEISTVGNLSSPIYLEYKLELSENEYLIPIVFDEQEKNFVIEGSTNGNILILPHLSFWSAVIKKINDILNTSEENNYFANQAIKGAYIGWGLHGNATDFNWLLNELINRNYNKIYINRGGAIIDEHGKIVVNTPSFEVPQSSIDTECVFGINESDMSKINSTLTNFDDKVKWYQDRLNNVADEWVKKNESCNKIHLNIESFPDNNDEAATMALAELFMKKNKIVSTSFINDWDPNHLKKMDEAGVVSFSLQLYNLKIKDEKNLISIVDSIYENFKTKNITHDKLLLTLPYYGPITKYHTNFENISNYVNFLRKYKNLNKLGGAYVYDFAFVNDQNGTKDILGDDHYRSLADIEAFDTMYNKVWYFNGHFYKYVNEKVTWHEAKERASKESFNGQQGYLVTLTSLNENEFVRSIIKDTIWIGASDEEEEGVWKWVTGPERGRQFWMGDYNGRPVSDMYANWNKTRSQPASAAYPDEDYAIMPVHEAYSNGEWADGQEKTSRLGYVVEFGGID